MVEISADQHSIEITTNQFGTKSRNEDPNSNKNLSNIFEPRPVIPSDFSSYKVKKVRSGCGVIFCGVLKGFCLILLAYIFVCSLDLLSTSLQLLGGRATGNVFSHPLMSNPIVGLMIGILATVLVQSSSTSTSIVVSLVAAGYFPSIKTAIPMIMGANVGTSVTNTIVALTRIGDRAEFGRAFAGATVHDMFNWLTVIILLILETTTGYLYIVTEALLNAINLENRGEHFEIQFLKFITDPATQAVLMIDETVMHGWVTEDPEFDEARLLKIYCGDTKCSSLCSVLSLNDTTTGAIMTVVSLVLLCGCLVLLVKLLQNVLQGPMAVVLQKTVNADIPYVPWLTGYLAMLVGAVATFLLQSSSVFTSALTPLVGMGIITVSRTYPLTLGSNIGTTTTAILAALTAPSERLRDSLQVAFCHLFFNVTGILIFYPIPFMRWPLPLARCLGRTTARYRWFAIAYLLLAFFLIPILVLGTTLLDPSGVALLAIGVPFIVLLTTITMINVIKKRCPDALPKCLRNWQWLPPWLRSLAPLDRAMGKMLTWSDCCRSIPMDVDDEEGEQGVDNITYQNMQLE